MTRKARARAIIAAFAIALPVSLAWVPEPASAQSAEALRYPYVAAFSRADAGNRVYFCAGALIAPRWVLTAAHCFHSRDGRTIPSRGIAAAVGRERLRSASERAQVGVEKIVIHPRYDLRSQANDIALVHLEEEAGYLVADFATGFVPEPDHAVILGFGSLYEGRLAGRAVGARGDPSAQVSDELGAAPVRLVDPDLCARRADIGDAFGGPDRLCAAAPPEIACTADSGGPMVAETPDERDHVIGILSYGSGCGVAAPVGIFTRVGAYSDWIVATLALD